jgi:PhnB protein
MDDSTRKKINTTPEHYNSVTPWIISASSEKLIAFLISAFDAEELANSKIVNEAGIVIHVVVKIGNSMIMLFDSRDGWGPTPTYLNLYVDDVELAHSKAIELGATSVTRITELWFGEKVCRILDPFGNLWWINERVEEVDFTDIQEIGKRASTQKAIEGISYIQTSLNEALLAQKDFLSTK